MISCFSSSFALQVVDRRARYLETHTYKTCLARCSFGSRLYLFFLRAQTFEATTGGSPQF
jgi:hypothetical protein